MKGGRRLGGKINTYSSAVKKLLSAIRVITTELRKAKTSPFQGKKKITILNSCMPFIPWKSWPLLLIMLKSKMNL